jgi:hypothetical protein
VGIRELRLKYENDDEDSIPPAACINLDGIMNVVPLSASAFVTCLSVVSFELV